MIKQLLESNLGIGKLKIGFLGEKCLVPEATWFSSPSASDLARLASGPYVSSPQRVVVLASQLFSSRLPVLRSCVFFAHLCFELDFDINMKIVDN